MMQMNLMMTLECAQILSSVPVVASRLVENLATHNFPLNITLSDVSRPQAELDMVVFWLSYNRMMVSHVDATILKKKRTQATYVHA